MSIRLPLKGKAVARAISKLPESRDRSVVRSSVIPSAKYSWSGSFDRLLKGSTTIERRGADLRSPVGGFCAPVATIAGADPVDGVPLGQLHQAAAPMAITAMMHAARAASRELLLRQFSPMGGNGIVTSGNDAAAVALSA